MLNGGTIAEEMKRIDDSVARLKERKHFCLRNSNLSSLRARGHIPPGTPNFSNVRQVQLENIEIKTGRTDWRMYQQIRLAFTMQSGTWSDVWACRRQPKSENYGEHKKNTSKKIKPTPYLWEHCTTLQLSTGTFWNRTDKQLDTFASARAFHDIELRNLHATVSRYWIRIWSTSSRNAA